jgi:alpha-L-fucosidase
MTLGGGWGYKKNDKKWIPAKYVVHDIVDCVSKDGNLLLNVGPNAYGEFPKEAVDILTQVGEWLKVNGESVYGCGMSEYKFADFGRYTQKGNRLYLHILDKTNRPIRLEGLLDKYESVHYLADGAEVVMIPPNSFHGPIYRQYPGDAFFFLGSRGEPMPDEMDTVIEITLKENK